MAKIEEGIMLVKDGKGWGIAYEDGRETSYGWVALEEAEIYTSPYCKKPSDIARHERHYIKEMNKGDIVKVTRTTTVKIHG